jgi:hypothetical protein
MLRDFRALSEGKSWRRAQDWEIWVWVARKKKV